MAMPIRLSLEYSEADGPEAAYVSKLIGLAGDLIGIIVERQPEHSLAELWMSIGSLHDGFDALQIEFGIPGKTPEERCTYEGQCYFWERYIEALDAATRPDLKAPEVIFKEALERASAA